MPSEHQRNSALTAISTQPEKPFHYTYLKEFRTQQCQDFLQHKCPNHRPFTCFHWHFLNQRRRRPIRKRGGTFNYSPDVYCTKYDDTTGICPDGEECQYLHRNTGDTERRYHLRYYKTGTCVHETDARGHCVKNGPHCAFAHGPHDLRQPVYDIREMSVPQPPPTASIVDVLPTNGNGSVAAGTSPIPSSTISDKEKIIVDDPVWNDTIYVLANYKTEPCKRPPRLCRQGYACPQYHNVRDRRRSPRLYRYRSTPCPNVKHGDEWGELSACEQGDECQYCHTRTEQQFHPEIYKSSKCNDMQQTGYCPRGPFCAFAHVDQEMSSQRDFNQELGNLPTTTNSLYPVSSGSTTLGQHITSLGGGDNHIAQISSSGPGPIAKPRSNSASSSYSSESSHPSSSFPKTVSSDKDETSTVFSHGTTLGHLITHSSQNHSQIYGVGSNMSANAMPFYPPSDTVESVIGNALDDLNLDDFDVSALDRELDNDNSSIGSSGPSLSQITASLGLGSTSQPVNIPSGSSSSIALNHKSSISESPVSPLSQLPPAFVPHHIQQQKQQQQQIEQAAAAFMSRPNTGTNQSLRNISNLGSLLVAPGSPVNSGRSNQSSMMSPGSGGGGNLGNDSEVQRLQDEVNSLRNKLQTWEESWKQAKQACDAWKQEASDWAKKAEYADQERQSAIHAKEEAVKESQVMKQEIEGLTGGPHLHVLHKVSELSSLSLSKLKQLRIQLQGDLERVDKLVHTKEALSCTVCQNHQRSIAVLPCSHLVFCAACSASRNECSICHQKITSKTNISIPL